MKKPGYNKYSASIIIAACYLLALGNYEQAHAVNVFFMYTLSDFTGPIIYDGARVYVDAARNEAYVVSKGIVRVFNDNGMEIYRFNDDNELGAISSLDFDQEGDIYALSYKYGYLQASYNILHCNYRGELQSTIEIKGVPSSFKDFMPRYTAYRDHKFYLADPSNLSIVITDMSGQVQKSFDLIPLLELKESDRQDTEMGGFSVDKDGNMLFTIPTLFTASVLSPDGKIASFGTSGSIPGKFANLSDIIRDNRGNILVADKLKDVVNIFDKNFNFLMEFGGRGNAPGNIVIPESMAIDSDNKLFITQASSRGVSVFRLLYN
jgi:DNA-binding beta-propeller fold protein YncE